jgi:hypothetical protein
MPNRRDASRGASHVRAPTAPRIAMRALREEIADDRIQNPAGIDARVI